MFSGEDCSGCGIGETDLCVEVGGIVIAWAGSGALGAEVGSAMQTPGSFAPEGWNSGGFVRGVAWTLVMSFALEK